ncbi:MAG: glycosyltransferase family 4 protein [Pseudomonadota bacterium]
MADVERVMAIYFINRFFYPDHAATSQILSDLAFALAARGHEIHIITSRLRYDDASQRLRAAETIKGVHVHRIWSTGFGRGRLAGRFIDYATFYASLVFSLLKHVRRADVVVAKTDPPMLSVIAGPLCRLRRAVAVNWLQDIFPEVVLASPERAAWWKRAGFNILAALRTRSCRLAATNVVLGARMAERVKSWAPTIETTVIANWAVGEEVRPVPASANGLRKDWGLERAFVIGYSGNLGRAHEMATFVQAFDALHQRFGQTSKVTLPDGRTLQALFIGGGALYEALRAHVEVQGPTWVRFEPYMPREALAESLSVPDVHLVSLRPELEGLIVPSKIYGIAAAGRAAVFVGDPDGEVARLLKAGDAGLTVAPGDGEGLAEALLALARDSERTAQMGVNARAMFDDAFDVGHAIAAWEQLLARLGAPAPDAALHRLPASRDSL